ncbi:hypothetical protein [Dolichospermum phage Dfl-JY23]
MIAMINKETRLKVVYKTLDDKLIIISPRVSYVDSKTLEIAIKILDGKINIDSLLVDPVDVVDDGASYIEAPEKFWKTVKDVEGIVKTTEDTYFHKYGVSVYEKNTIIVKRKK